MKRIGLYIALLFVFAGLSAQSNYSPTYMLNLAFAGMPKEVFPHDAVGSVGRSKAFMYMLARGDKHQEIADVYGGRILLDLLSDRHLKISFLDSDNLEYHILIKDISETEDSFDNSFYFIQTTCGPICSSIVEKRRIRKWEIIERLLPLNEHELTEAVVENDEIKYIDHMHELLDEQETNDFLIIKD